MPQLEWTKLPLDDELPTYWATSHHTMPNGTPLRYEILGGATYGAFAHNLFLDADNAHRRHFSTLEAAKAACQANEDELTRRADGGKAELLAACEASEQCIADFIEVYKRGCSHLVMDEAVKSLRSDALKKVRAAIANTKGTP